MGALYRDAWKTLAAAGFALAMGPGDAMGQPTPPPVRPAPPGVLACNEIAHRQSLADERVINAVQSAFARQGFPAVLARLGDLKVVISHAPPSLPRYEWCDDRVVVITSTLDEYFVAQARFARYSVVWRPSSYAQASILAGGALLQAGRYGEAIPILQAGLALEPGNSGLAGEVVVALNMTGRLAEGLTLAETTLNRNLDMPDTERAHLLRAEGYAFGELGRFDEAESAYRTSLEIEPGNRTAMTELGYIARRRAGAQRTPVRRVITRRPTTGMP